jgi:capsid portal protein
MNCTSNENIQLHYNYMTKGAVVGLNRKEGFNDYIDLYHDNDSLFAEEKYTFYVSSI